MSIEIYGERSFLLSMNIETIFSSFRGNPRNFAGNFILNSIVDGEYPPIQEDWVLDDESYGFRREGLPRKGAKERGKDSLDSFRAMVE